MVLGDQPSVSKGENANMAQNSRQKKLFTYEPAHELLDAVNIRLLDELRQEPRLTMSELGRRVGMSAPAVTERVRRMEEANIILGYRLEINPVPLGLPIAAFIRIRPNPGQLPKVAQVAQEIPEVVECHRITGEDCFILKVHIPAMDQLDRILDTLLIYGTTTTSIIQSSPVPPRVPPLTST
jgi:Lrp/AsnC family transcriptional regulator, leucine-responsive regulatory protein